MCLRYLGFILFVWFPGVLHGQSPAQPCPAPSLSGGYVVPDQKTYAHGTDLTYACNNGSKPAVEGWWATVTCHNGTWSHKPQCIDEKSCLPPTIPHGTVKQQTANQNGWYEDGHTIRIKCDSGYSDKENDATAACINGTWSSLPVCERSNQACDEPPRIPHAVITQRYQEVFAVDSNVEYECEDGYIMEGGDSSKTIICISGSWTERPTCKSMRACEEPPQIPHAAIVQGYEERFESDAEVTYNCSDGYTVEGGDSNISIFCISGLWTEHAKCRSNKTCDEPPQIPNANILSLGDQKQFEPDSLVTYDCEDGYTVEGGGTQKSAICRNGSWSELPTCIRKSRPSTGHDGDTVRPTTSDSSGPRPGAGGFRPGPGHGGSAGGGHTRPVGGGSSTSSGDRQFIGVSHCGKPPVVPEAEVVQTREMFLKYQCSSYYKLMGPQTVKCYSDGSWSEVPTCKATFCTVNTAEHPDLKPAGVKYVTHGEEVELECVDKFYFKNFSVVTCTDGTPNISRCCNRAQIKTGTC